ncbi:hypothetical protein D3C80_820230 [compost metagenome]
MGVKPFLRRIDEVMRQKQDTVSTDLFDRAGNINGDLGAVTAAGNNGGFAGNFLGGGDDGGDLIRLQRKELARAAGGKQHRRLVSGEPFDMRPVAIGRKTTLGIEMGDRERQQTGAKRRLDLFRVHHRNSSASSLTESHLSRLPHLCQQLIIHLV